MSKQTRDAGGPTLSETNGDAVRARRALRAGSGGIVAGAAAIVACELPWVLALIGFGAAPFLDAFAGVALVAGAGLIGFGLWRRRAALAGSSRGT